MPVFIDAETYSAEPIKNGHFKYAENVEILMIAWAVDDADPEIWDAKRDVNMPSGLRDILRGEDILIAHNAAFEQAVFSADLAGCKIDPKRWRCSMARAYAHGLPGSLDSLCTVLGLRQEHKKSKEGYDLIRLFCVPLPKNAKRGRATRDTHPEQWERFKTYCKQDIVAAREVWRKLPEWNYKGDELALWHLDQKINQRGLCIDLELVNAAIRAVDRAQEGLRARTEDLTLGNVSSATKRDAMLAHILAFYGIELPDMQASTLERRIEDPDLPEELKELLRIRLQATTSSTAKYQKIVKCVSSDGRLRGTLQFAGAARTARWSGRLLQPQNLPRQTFSPEEIELGIDSLKNDCADILYDNVMEVASNVIRGVIVASKGKKLVISDLSNIEGRDQAWIAGEDWKIKAFRDFDEGTGPDLYALAYAKAFRVTPESVLEDKKKGGNQRQIGKTLELAMGYHGGVAAFITFAAIYDVDLNDLKNKAWDLIPPDVKQEALDFWEYCVKQKRTLGLEKEVFVTCDSLKRMWRRAHPNSVRTWANIENATRDAISAPGNTIPCGKLKMRRDGNWFRIVLPSGRALCYPHPQLDNKGVISFMGVDQYTRKWSRIETFSGKLFENVCQAVARDVMAANMPLIESAGYEIVTTVHDEVVCEAPDNEEFNEGALSALLSANPPWAPDMPLAAGGYESHRYRKG
jgi:DNA polymerase